MMARAETRLSEAQQERLQSIIALKGLSQASRFLLVSPRTLQVASLGGGLQAATVALIEKRFAERDAAGKVP